MEATTEMNSPYLEPPTGEELKAIADRIAKRRNPGCQSASYVFLVEAEWIDEDATPQSVAIAYDGGSWLARQGLAYEYLTRDGNVIE